MRTYRVVAGKLDAFTALFEQHLLPIQLRHGARLIGRWVTPDDERVVALWAYDSEEELGRIGALVRTDPASTAARARREELEPLLMSTDEVLLRSTIPLAATELAHLDRRG